MNLKEMGISSRKWVVSAQDRDYWRALVNAAMKLLVPYPIEIFVFHSCPVDFLSCSVITKRLCV